MILIVLLCGCSDLKITPEMQAGIDAYLEAVDRTVSRSAGKITVTTVTDDQAIDFTATKSVMEFDYRIVDGKVIFTRTDKKDGKLQARFESDGETVKLTEGSFADDIDKSFASYLNAASNPLVTLSLFRVDSKNKIRTDMLSGIEYSDGSTVKFTLKNSAVNTVLGYNKAKGIVRNSKEQSFTYFLDSGLISKIVLDSEQVVYSNGKEGSYKITITVDVA